MFGHPHMFGCPHMFGRCLDACCTYTTQIKHALQIERVSICLHTLGCPICLDALNMFGCPLFGCTPCMFGCPICLDNPLYVWMLPMFGYPPILMYVWMSPYVWILPFMYFWTPTYVWMPPYVWKMFGCLLYIYIIFVYTNKTCFVRLRGYPYASIHLDAPICLALLRFWMPPYIWMSPCMFKCSHMCGHPLYVWMPPCLDATYMFGHPLYVWVPPTVWTPPIYLDVPLYVWLT